MDKFSRGWKMLALSKGETVQYPATLSEKRNPRYSARNMSGKRQTHQESDSDSMEVETDSEVESFRRMLVRRERELSQEMSPGMQNT